MLKHYKFIRCLQLLSPTQHDDQRSPGQGQEKQQHIQLPFSFYWTETRTITNGLYLKKIKINFQQANAQRHSDQKYAFIYLDEVYEEIKRGIA